jgi:hypothetical protein
MTNEPVPFGGEMNLPETPCEEAFFHYYPDFYYPNSTALNLWTQAWNQALDWKELQENKKPLIQLL